MQDDVVHKAACAAASPAHQGLPLSCSAWVVLCVRLHEIQATVASLPLMVRCRAALDADYHRPHCRHAVQQDPGLLANFSNYLLAELTAMLQSVGRAVAMLHDGGLVHGDLTTSNMMLRDSDHALVSCCSYSATRSDGVVAAMLGQAPGSMGTCQMYIFL